MLSPWIDANAIVPLYIGCLTLPAFVVANTQDGIARSHDWMRLGLMPQFIVRQSLIIGLTAGAFALGFNLGATAAMLASAAAVWIAMIGQMIVLNRRLGGHIEPGPKAYDFRGWLAVSLPILMVEGFYLLLSYTDVLVLQQFRSSEEVGVYFAVVKTLALVSLHSLRDGGDDGASLCRISRAGRQGAAVGLCRARDPVDVLAVAGRDRRCCWRWASRCCGCSGRNSWSATTSCSSPRSACVVRSAIGPVERLLNMLGHQHICALAYALAFVMNLVLCVVLVPRFGGHGAAAATSIALAFETVLLFWIVRRRLGLHVTWRSESADPVIMGTTPSAPRTAPLKRAPGIVPYTPRPRCTRHSCLRPAQDARLCRHCCSSWWKQRSDLAR